MRFVKFLILSLIVGACTTPPRPTKFDANWQLVELSPFDEEPHACLSMEEVKKLRELLIRCEK